MTLSLKAAAIALAFTGGIVATAAHARPPTVSNSPGYDARLAESRKAQQQYLRAAPMEAPSPRMAKSKTAKSKK
jgi:hypothetical protein